VEPVAAVQEAPEVLHEEVSREVEAEGRREDGVGSAIEVEERQEVEVASLGAGELQEVRTLRLEAVGLAEDEGRPPRVS
jgi:hypothetical protein